MSNYKESSALGEVTWEYCKKSGTGGFWGWVRGAVGDAAGAGPASGMAHSRSNTAPNTAALHASTTETEPGNSIAQMPGQVGISRQGHVVIFIFQTSGKTLLVFSPQFIDSSALRSVPILIYIFMCIYICIKI